MLLPKHHSIEHVRHLANVALKSADAAKSAQYMATANALEQRLKDLRQLVHVAKNELLKKGVFQSDEDYRLLLQQATESKQGALDGKTSTKAMQTLAELDAVVKALRKKGFKLRYKKNPSVIVPTLQRGNAAPTAHAVMGDLLSRPLADGPQDKKLRALWLDMHKQGIVKDPSEEGLAKWVKREYQFDALQWLNSDQCSNAIEKLKKWQRRELVKRANPPPEAA